MKKVNFILLFLLFSFYSCNKVKYYRQEITIKIWYIDKQLPDTISEVINKTHIRFSPDIYAADRPVPCLGFAGKFLACNVRKFDIIDERMIELK